MKALIQREVGGNVWVCLFDGLLGYEGRGACHGHWGAVFRDPSGNHIT